MRDQTTQQQKVRKKGGDGTTSQQKANVGWGSVTDAQWAVDAAIAEAVRLRKSLGKRTSRQVSSADERHAIRATALTWFSSHRGALTTVLGPDQLKGLDQEYQELLGASTRETRRSRYLEVLRRIKKNLGQLQSDHAIPLSSTPAPQQPTSDAPPRFSSLVSDVKMQAILSNRWQECVQCVAGNAPLAGIVMMGGLLEALLLAKINQLPNKEPVFKAVNAPRDRAGKTLPLPEWGLKNYIDVARELGWISQSAKEVGEVLRDYRNYIHPYKEQRHGTTVSTDDSRLLWEVAKSIGRELLRP